MLSHMYISPRVVGWRLETTPGLAMCGASSTKSMHVHMLRHFHVDVYSTMLRLGGGVCDFVPC